MSLYSPDDITPKAPRYAAAPALAPQSDAEQPHAASSADADTQQEHCGGSRVSRWPLFALAVAALITLIWNALLIWALIGVFFNSAL